MAHGTNWNHWGTVRHNMTNRNIADCKSGKDVEPKSGLLFLCKGMRPQHLSDMVSPTDGGVVTHSLQYIDDQGTEHWSCNEDSTPMTQLMQYWPSVTVVPDDWKFKKKYYGVKNK